MTSEASQGQTVDKVFVGISSQSFPAANQRRFLVPATRGKEQVVVFTDDKKELLRTIQRADQPLSATELAEPKRRRMLLRRRLGRHLAFLGRLTAFARTHDDRWADRDRSTPIQRENAHGR